MRIEVSSGIGFGPTELAAFDAALIAAGVANFNLLVLSSVIPNGSEVVVRTDPLLAPSGSWGDRLYVVLAQHRVSLRNAEAWAGLGWVQDERTGRGLFVEHHGNAHAEVQQDIADSLTALCESRGESFGAQQMTIAGATCHAEPACAVVVATYQSAKWQ
jgi:arginine decarboxylase